MHMSSSSSKLTAMLEKKGALLRKAELDLQNAESVCREELKKISSIVGGEVLAKVGVEYLG